MTDLYSSESVAHFWKNPDELADKIKNNKLSPEEAILILGTAVIFDRREVGDKGKKKDDIHARKVIRAAQFRVTVKNGIASNFNAEAAQTDEMKVDVLRSAAVVLTIVGAKLDTSMDARWRDLKQTIGGHNWFSFARGVLEAFPERGCDEKASRSSGPARIAVGGYSGYNGSDDAGGDRDRDKAELLTSELGFEGCFGGDDIPRRRGASSGAPSDFGSRQP